MERLKVTITKLDGATLTYEGCDSVEITTDMAMIDVQQPGEEVHTDPPDLTEVERIVIEVQR